MHHAAPFDPALDLRFSRLVDVPRASVWRAWTEPELLSQWFCPLPWTTTDAEIDLRAGGIFRTTMCSPEGQEHHNLGCYLQVLPQEQLVWTNALLPGFRPSAQAASTGSDAPGFVFTATIALSDEAQGTRYSATVRHADASSCQKHAAMGFEAGWGMALDQLVAMVQRGI